MTPKKISKNQNLKLYLLLRYYFGIKILNVQSHFKRMKLNLSWRSNHLHLTHPLIPKPTINQNSNLTNNIDDYVSEYLSLQTSFYPFIANEARLSASSVTLDFGCGVGRLAAAFKLDITNTGSYFGYDTNPRAVKFCNNTYRNDPRFSFFAPDIDSTTNYLTNKRLATADRAFNSRYKAYPSNGDISKFLNGSLITCQISLSAFTHMWPDDVIESLRVFREFSTQDATFINTWLILDDFASAAVSNRHADRNLPIEVGGIFTYSQLNPLVCTAYPIEKLKKVYSDAGHKIIDIKFGSWSGRCNGVTYQDIVISNKL